MFKFMSGLVDSNEKELKRLQPYVDDINETYKEFTFPSLPRTHFGSTGNVVVCSTMTKFYGLGRLRVGWIMADKNAARRLSYAKWAVSGHDSEYSLWIATQVLRKRQRFVKRARGIQSRNIKLVRRFTADTEGVSTELGAAPFCLVRYKRGPGSGLRREPFPRRRKPKKTAIQGNSSSSLFRIPCG
jgi:histidinol-phosphate/aromatic aminotransferase/cobyric acid decarboxylase-like protein